MSSSHSNSDQLYSVFWFRRDLRLNDNVGLYHALMSGRPVIPLFIFDREILDRLKDRSDKRVQFIHRKLLEMHNLLQGIGSSMWIEYGDVAEVWNKLLAEFSIAEVYANHDYEPYARKRDKQIEKTLKEQGIPFNTFKDQVIFEKNEVMTNNGKIYTVFTPYRNKWREMLHIEIPNNYPSENLLESFYKMPVKKIPSLRDFGFQKSGELNIPTAVDEEIILNYHKTRDVPGINGTSRLGVHLRFGTISIRQLVNRAEILNEVFVDELIWREFFMMSLWHFPHLVNQPFREQYKNFTWRQNKSDFERWCHGKTGFPVVDAGMRELNATGYMHNRVRMITANFLTKLLLIDWRLGEAYFAEKLLDYEQSSNVGNWQWSAGCGVDAAPYFRIFNPHTQLKKFDPDLIYVKRWIKEFGTAEYPKPMIDYQNSRQRALDLFKSIY